MSQKDVKNIAASVRQRLLNLTKEKGEDFQLWLDRYAGERLLYRLSQSEHRNSFALKGAVLFAIWSDEAYRATRDIDLLGWGENSANRLCDVFSTLCLQEVVDDGLIFDVNSINAEEIRETQEYGGLRITLKAYLDGARANVQVDIGFGDVITPEPVEVEYTSILGFPPTVLRAYPRETVIAEKVHAMVVLGMANSRLKDFSDTFYLANQFTFDGQLLCRALKATFTRRETKVPEQMPLALTERFYNSQDKQSQWKAFNRKAHVNPILNLEDVCLFLQGFLMPPLAALASDSSFEQTWHPEDSWRSRDQQ